MKAHESSVMENMVAMPLLTLQNAKSVQSILNIQAQIDSKFSLKLIIIWMIATTTSVDCFVGHI